MLELTVYTALRNSSVPRGHAPDLHFLLLHARLPFSRPSVQRPCRPRLWRVRTALHTLICLLRVYVTITSHVAMTSPLYTTILIWKLGSLQRPKCRSNYIDYTRIQPPSPIFIDSPRILCKPFYGNWCSYRLLILQREQTVVLRMPRNAKYVGRQNLRFRRRSSWLWHFYPSSV